MTDGKGLINVDLGDLGKAANTLIKKVSDGIGGAFAPRQLVRMAKAQAEANQIAASSQIEISELQRRALSRLAAEEARKQSNIEQITANAIPLLEDKSQPENMDDDWITNFFEKSRIVSDKEMQSLWSRLLASEANQPGTVSKRAINLLADLDKGDAEYFSTLCNFGWNIFSSYIPLIFSELDKVVDKYGLDYEVLGHLESLGLVRLGNVGEFQIKLSGETTFPVSYFTKSIILKVSSGTFRVGKVLLTPTGKQLSKIATTGPLDGVYDYARENFEKRKIVVAEEGLTTIPSAADEERMTPRKENLQTDLQQT